MEYRYQVGNEVRAVRIEREGDVYRVSIDGARPRTARLVHTADGMYNLQIDGATRRVYIARDGQRRLAAMGSDRYELKIAERTQRHGAGQGDGGGSLEAQMPGQVIAVAVHESDEVTKGQTLVILEAMKMELRVVAPYDGRIKRVLVEVGQVVERGQQLVELIA